MQAEHQANSSPENTGPGDAPASFLGTSSKFLKLLTWILIVMFPVGLFIMFSGFGKQFLWTTTIFLGLEALLMFLVINQNWGLVRAAGSALVIFTVSLLVEWYGVSSGIPFGNYIYTDVLQPKLFGVPIAIAFAWFTVTSASMLAVRSLLYSSSALAISFISASLILATDILLEPFASFVNGFWIWEFNKIPLQNFLSWFGLGFIFSLVLNKLLNPKRHTAPVIPVIIIVINILNFSIVNIANGYYMLSAAGLIIFAVIIIPSLVFRTKQAKQI